MTKYLNNYIQSTILELSWLFVCHWGFSVPGGTAKIVVLLFAWGDQHPGWHYVTAPLNAFELSFGTSMQFTGSGPKDEIKSRQGFLLTFWFLVKCLIYNICLKSETGNRIDETYITDSAQQKKYFKREMKLPTLISGQQSLIYGFVFYQILGTLETSFSRNAVKFITFYRNWKLAVVILKLKKQLKILEGSLFDFVFKLYTFSSKKSKKLVLLLKKMLTSTIKKRLHPHRNLALVSTIFITTTGLLSSPF